jgi:hypothetical protein
MNMSGRTFAPALNVMVEQPAVLAEPDLSLAGLLTRFPGLAKVDAVGLTGSVAAGFGNALSDIDLFVFADNMPDLPVDETMETWSSGEGNLRTTTWMGRYGDHRVDLKVWPTEAPRLALSPFLEDVAPEFCEVSHSTMDYIYRLSIARPLAGEPFFDNVRQLIETSHYGPALARSLKLAAEARLLDVAGQLMSGDLMSARLTAVEAASIAVDCRLVLTGDYCRSQKWLLRRLDKGGAACGISPATFRSDVLDGPRAGESDIAHVTRVAHWARDAISAVESELLV